MIDTRTNTGKAAFTGALAAVVVGVCVLAGWLFDLEVLKRIAPGFVAMNPATAVAFILAGASLALFLQSPHGRDQKSRALVLTARFCALVVTVIGLARLVGILDGWDLGVDRWLFASRLPDDLRFPNRIAPNTALDFLLLGSALLLVDVKKRSVRVCVEFFVVIVGFGSLLAVLAYAYDIPSFYGFSVFIPMALHTAITFSVLVVVFLLSHTDSGLLAVFAGDSVGGKMARRLLPAAVLVPAVLGWLTRQGEEAGIYHGGFSNAVFAVESILVFTFLVCWSAKGLSSADLVRKKAEAARRQSDEQFRTMFELASVGIAQADPRTGRWLRVNKKMCEISGYSTAEMLQMRVSEITHPEDRQKDWEKFERVVRGEAPDYRMEKRYLRKDGTLAWVNVNMTIIRDAAGQPSRTMAAIEDITERKQAEAALRSSEERFRIAAETANDVIYEWDLKQSVEWLGKIDDLLGYEPGEFPRTLNGFAASVHPEDLERTMAAIQAHLEGRGPYAIEYRVRRKNGVYRWWSARGAVARTPDGKPTRWIGSITDVTERKRAEEALRESADRLSLATESALVGIWELDLEKNVLIWDKRMYELYGIRPEDFGGAYEAWEKGVHSDDLVAVRTELQDAIAGKKDFHTQFRVVWPDGHIQFVEAHAVVQRAPNGTPLRVIGVNGDITERKRAEQRLCEQAEMLDHAHDAIVIRNFDDQRIVFWNSAAEHLYGWSASEAIGRPIGELLHVDPKERAEALRILLDTGEFRGEFNQVTKDGRKLIGDVRVTIVRNPDGTPRSVLMINTDVTEQKKLEMQLLRAQRLESIGTLASGVAHDLNNILSPILMCAQTLRGDLAEEDRQLAISLIEESAQRGAAVVKQVLTFARGIEGERVLIKPSHLIEEMIDIAHQTFPKSIEIRSRYAEDLWSIEGDPTQLHQVLLNLSINARDAMPNGGSLTLGAENFTVDENYAAMSLDAKVGSYVVLCVSDSGAGMPRETIDKIFDPFFTTKELGKGTGLGLSTALGIVKSHGGFISVDSEVGKGTIFKIFLPAEVSDQSVLPSETRVAPAQGNGELVLVVDDEENILRATRTVLEQNNYRVVSASDGVEALAVFAQQMQAIRVVLTDISMPHMDGVAAVRALRKMKPDVPIIAFTGQAQQARLNELQAMNVNNCLIKPFNTENLLAAIHTSVGTGNEVEAK